MVMFDFPIRLRRHTTGAVMQEVRAAVGAWREQANALGIARSEQEIMAAAFEESQP